MIVYASSRGWISREATGKAGAAVVGVLSMGEALLLVEIDGTLRSCLDSNRSSTVIPVLVSGVEVGRGKEGLGGSADRYP